MGLFKSLGKIVKGVTKPVKKVLKSPLGKAALLYGAYHFGPAALQPGQGLRGLSGWQKALTSKAPWLYSADATGKSASTGILADVASKWRGMGPLGKAATVGIGTAAASQFSPAIEEKVDIDVDDKEAHQKYLTNRGSFEDEWAEWLVSKGDADTKEEALVMVRNNPMFSQGGRVKANIGLFAGQMGGMNRGMNQMNQGLGSPNLGPRSMGMTPGMGAGGGQMDPRMAQLMQGRARPRTTGIPKQSEDTELIQLIKMLTSLGIPMEQLRGRTKEELVEMMVSVSGKGGQEKVVEEDVIEEQDRREQQAAGGGLMRTGYAMGTEHPIIPSKDGQQLDMRDRGGYQPHGKAEKHDDVRALLAQGEFVMTSDAVKGLGGGDREQGAKKMYNMMHNLEAMA